MWKVQPFFSNRVTSARARVGIAETATAKAPAQYTLDTRNPLMTLPSPSQTPDHARAMRGRMVVNGSGTAGTEARRG